MAMNVANCPRCGKLYVKNVRDLCPACNKEIDMQLEACIKYLRENRKTTLGELSEATGVDVKQITKFIREGRLSITSTPNMGYGCEVCGTSIREHNICDSCRKRLSKDVNHMQEDDKRNEEMRQQENQVSYNIKDRLKDRLR